MSIFRRYYSELVQEAYKSPICNKLAACILKDKKMIGRICCNTDRNFCRGNECGSLHAEAHALLNYFGKSLQFDRFKNKWYLLPNRYEKYKKI